MKKWNWITLDHHPNDSRLEIKDDDICQTLNSRMGTGGGNVPLILGENEDNMSETVVRRLSPTECERLQGFPDNWTNLGEWEDLNGKVRKPSDSPRYKALGNSIALPQWWWLVNRLKPYVGEGATMGSLFDGISGFPLVWEETYGPHTAKWTSEIEDFPIAVCKRHFGDEDKGIIGDLYPDERVENKVETVEFNFLNPPEE